MKIKYLKDTHDARAGDVREVEDAQGKVLVLLGTAEPHQAETKRKSKGKNGEA